MGVQDLNFSFVQRVADALLWSSRGGGGWGGVITFLTSIKHGPRNLLPLLTCCFSRQGGGGKCMG